MMPIDAPVEIHADAVGTWFQSPRQFNAAAGPRVGVRLGDRTTVGVAAGVGWLAAPMSTVQLEVGRRLRPEGWRPWIGLRATASWGRFRMLSAERPRPVRGPAVTLSLAARPCVLELGDLSLSTMEISAGVMTDQPLASRVFSLGVLGLGYRL